MHTPEKHTFHNQKKKKELLITNFAKITFFKKSLHTVENLLVKWCGMIKFFTCPKKFEKCIEAACSSRQKKKAKIQNEGQHLGWKKVNNLAFLLLLPSVLILYLFSDHLLGFRFEKNRCSMLPTFCCLYNCRLFSQLFLRLPSLLLSLKRLQYLLLSCSMHF